MSSNSSNFLCYTLSTETKRQEFLGCRKVLCDKNFIFDILDSKNPEGCFLPNP